MSGPCIQTAIQSDRHTDHMLAITVIREDFIYHGNEFATMFVSAAPSVPKTNLGLRITDPIASIECLKSRASLTRWGWI
jgi:hypothetical protein